MKYLKNAVHSMKKLPVSLRTALSNRCGEGYVDTAVKILMAVVIGALVLAGLYALFDDPACCPAGQPRCLSHSLRGENPLPAPGGKLPCHRLGQHQRLLCHPRHQGHGQLQGAVCLHAQLQGRKR